MTVIEEAPLTLVLTRRCELRCGYCPQSFAQRDMSLKVLEAAIGNLMGRITEGAPIKLFGGNRCWCRVQCAAQSSS